MKTYLIQTSYGLVTLDESFISFLVELWLAKGSALWMK